MRCLILLARSGQDKVGDWMGGWGGRTDGGIISPRSRPPASLPSTDGRRNERTKETTCRKRGERERDQMQGVDLTKAHLVPSLSLSLPAAAWDRPLARSPTRPACALMSRFETNRTPFVSPSGRLPYVVVVVVVVRLSSSRKGPPLTDGCMSSSLFLAPLQNISTTLTSPRAARRPTLRARPGRRHPTPRSVRLPSPSAHVSLVVASLRRRRRRLSSSLQPPPARPCFSRSEGSWIQAPWRGGGGGGGSEGGIEGSRERERGRGLLTPTEGGREGGREGTPNPLAGWLAGTSQSS